MSGPVHFYRRVFGMIENKDYTVAQQALAAIAQFQTDGRRERCIFHIPVEGQENKRMLDAGWFSDPSVVELHERVARELPEVKGILANCTPTISVANIAGESNSLHHDPSLRGGVFQAASQFNYLEFPSPHVTPENGIKNYVYDRTQGPACAVACTAATAYRNYLARVGWGSERGQVADRQFNGLADVEAKAKALAGDPTAKFWLVKNGYINSSNEALEKFNTLVSNATVRRSLMELLRICVVEDTQVTNAAVFPVAPGQEPVTVTQTFNSAISVGYSTCSDQAWEVLARIVLDATYESTLLVGVLQTIKSLKQGGKPVPILLTKVGGGVFANPDAWIKDAMRASFAAVKKYGVPLDVRITHYGSVSPEYTEIAGEY